MYMYAKKIKSSEHERWKSLNYCKHVERFVSVFRMRMILRPKHLVLFAALWSLVLSMKLKCCETLWTYDPQSIGLFFIQQLAILNSNDAVPLIMGLRGEVSKGLRAHYGHQSPK